MAEKENIQHVHAEFNMSEEAIQFRIKKLKWMDWYLRQNVNDEDKFMLWLYIYPDGADSIDRESIAESYELFNDCLRSFTSILMSDKPFPEKKG